MELLDRYLNFIRFLLPRGKQQDIIDELSEDLHAQIADREAGLGRPLDTAELETILRQCGHPLLVAGRYQPQQQLIGQPFFPLYLFSLKAVQWVLLPLMLVVGAFIALFRSQPFIALIGAVGDAFMSCIYIVGLLTVAFILLERLQAKLTFLEDWKPSDLPKMPVVPDSIQIPRSASFGGFIGCLAFCLWWSGILHLPPVPQVQFLNPLPAGFFWPVLVLFGAEMLLHLANFFMPWWTRRRAAFRLAIDVFALGLSAAVIYSWQWLDLWIPGLSQEALAARAPADLGRVMQVLNITLLITVCVVALTYLARGLQDLRRTLGKPPIRNPLSVLFDFAAGKG